MLDKLLEATGGQAREATADDAVDGVTAKWVAAPSSTDQAAAVLRAAADEGAVVVVRGRGTALDWGRPPRAVDVVVSTEELDGIVEHEAGDLVCTVEAGTRIDDVNAAVADSGQQLALDQPVPGASVAGTLSTGRSGPRRMLYGSPRDLVLGVTMVRADGVVAKAGGKVVKNVAGYDLAKLVGGAYGTLGLVTRLVARLHPLPPASRWVSSSYASTDDAVAAALAVVGSQLAPTAVEVRRDAGADGAEVHVLVEGTEHGVAERLPAAAELLGPDSGDGPADTATLARVEAGNGDMLVKVAVPLTHVAELLRTVVDLEQRLGLPCRVAGSAGVGVLHVVVTETAGAGTGAADAVAELRAVTGQDAGAGSAVVLRAPAEIRDLVDTWGSVPALELMRRVKAEFDRDHRLAPGRFVGGI
ncbi:MAG: FAD-binding oxidoreductase [Actinomycetota bacterium]|nr:FAD-binding oxidoreductase [Actinomycetota bacterium]